MVSLPSWYQFSPDWGPCAFGLTRLPDVGAWSVPAPSMRPSPSCRLTCLLRYLTTLPVLSCLRLTRSLLALLGPFLFLLSSPASTCTSFVFNNIVTSSEKPCLTARGLYSCLFSCRDFFFPFIVFSRIFCDTHLCFSFLNDWYLLFCFILNFYFN